MWGVTHINRTDREDAIVYGTHIYGSLYGCSANLLRDEEYLIRKVREAAELANSVIVSIFSYKFGAHSGVSVIAIVAESHISVHTWPEYEYATIDVYTCGFRAKPIIAFEYLAKSLNAKKIEVYISDRSLYNKASVLKI